jgi:hypothetical protein
MRTANGAQPALAVHNTRAGGLAAGQVERQRQASCDDDPGLRGNSSAHGPGSSVASSAGSTREAAR